MYLVLYGKPGCHLCEGLEECLRQQTAFALTLEVRDITTQPDWWQRYQYEIPVVHQRLGNQDIPLPRPAGRLTPTLLERWLRRHLPTEHP
ncbi:MAG: glutaredoxin family protein [Gloeomargaritaceae cyanobacterium C42_A2020_066]|nr:glutaredoxin family protein [Gloeomargaritaceae cyanobacterium C42_A2020_066]